MTDRPIIFSGPMVRALLDGRKTQTRRLATSPLRKCVPGDRLWVREAWKATAVHDRIKPSELDRATRIYFTADDRLWPVARYRQGMHMPRWASRLTLIVDAVRFEPLQAISAEDAIAEGTTCYVCGTGRVDGTSENECACFHSKSSAIPSYQALWTSLHGLEGWLANPDVLVLTFRVERGNIDRIAA